MYYPANYMNLRFIDPQMTNRYQFNEFYIYNSNAVDLKHLNNQYFQYDNQYLLNDNFGTIRYNKNLVPGQETVIRTHKIKKSKKELCHNCKNETLRRKNVQINDYFSQNAQYNENNQMFYNDYSKYFTYTVPRNNKIKNPTIRSKSSRSKSINSEIKNKKIRSDSESNDEKIESKVSHSSRIQKFESKNNVVTNDNADLEPKIIEQEDKPKETIPPPPPPPPLDINLLKTNTSFVINRFNKLKSALPLSDEKASKSFDAVVNELKIKLNKIKPVKEQPKKDVPNEEISELKSQEKNEESLKQKMETLSITNVNRNHDNDSGIQSTDAISRKIEVNSNSSLVSACSKSSKQSSLNRLKNASKSNFGIIGIFKKKSSLLSSNSGHTNSSPNLDLTQYTDSTSDLKKEISSNIENQETISNNQLLNQLSSSESFKLEVLNDSADCSYEIPKGKNEEVKPLEEVKIASKKVLFDSPTNHINSYGFKDKTNQILKKIQKRNTFSSLKNSKIDLDSIEKKENEFENPVFKNRLVKSKSDYMNLNQKQVESKDVHSSYETYDLIKIESLVDLSNRENLITAFSTRNLFHIDKQKNEENKNVAEEKIDQNFDLSILKKEFKNRKINDLKEYLKLKDDISTEILKSKSEIKINKNQSDFIIRPIPSNYFCQNENIKDKTYLDKETKVESKACNLIPSKYSSFTDLSKNKQVQSQNLMNTKNESLKGKNLNEPRSIRLPRIVDEQTGNPNHGIFRPILRDTNYNKYSRQNCNESDFLNDFNGIDYGNQRNLLPDSLMNEQINEQINEEKIQLEKYYNAVSSLYSKNFNYRNLNE